MEKLTNFAEFIEQTLPTMKIINVLKEGECFGEIGA